MTGALKWPLELLPPQPLLLFRETDIYLSHPALKWRARPVLPRLGLARQASIDAVQTHAHGGSPRYCPELAGVRARFFTYKDCEPKWSSSPDLRRLLGLIRTVLDCMSYRREIGSPPR